MEKQHVAALKRAIAIAGSQSVLAEEIAKFMNRPTVSQQTVSKWLREETLIAAEYWSAFESITDGRVTRAQLRPDVHGRGKAA